MGPGEKVVIDTNVFISAFGWGGKPLKIIELLEKGAIRNCISKEIIEELALALSYPRLNFSYKIQSEILEFVLAYSDFCEPKERVDITSDPDDNKFLECAVFADARYIITGDKGLLSLGQFRNLKIITPEDFLGEFAEKTP